jgi:DNA-binding HxlR family transcriptional regulator
MPRPRAKSKSAAAAAELRSSCPIAGALDVVGDRWTLLVIRDLIMGKQRYGEFCASPEGIPTNILAERLARLEAAGIVTRVPYQESPPRLHYELTPKGEALKPVLATLGEWGARHIRGTRIPDVMKAALAPGAN